MQVNLIADPSLDKDKCSYNGQLYVNLTDKRFTFHPNNGMRQFSVFYDISGSEFKDDKLLMSLRVTDGLTSVVTIALEKVDAVYAKERVLEIVMETPALMMDCLKEEHWAFCKPLQMFGNYKLEGRGRTVRAVFRHHDYTEVVAVAGAHMAVYAVYAWLCGVWAPRCRCTEYYISIGGRLVPEAQTLRDYLDAGTVTFDVAERCVARPASGVGDSVHLPWHRDSAVLIGALARELAVDADRVRVLRPGGGDVVLRGGLKLGIAEFRRSSTYEPPTVLYDLTCVAVKCEPLVPTEGANDGVEVTVLRQCNATELKVQLGKVLGVDAKLLLISQGGKLVTKEAAVSVETAVQYCVCKGLEDIVIGPSVGKGGFGEVFQCTARSSGAVCALKRCFIGGEKDNNRDSVVKEIRVMSMVPPHTNLVRFDGLHVDGDENIYIAMEFLGKGSLKARILQGPLKPDTIRSLLSGMLLGLRHLHQHGVIHRDVKADNVLIGDGDVAKLCDFGISRDLANLSNRATIFGTKRYMAPEIRSEKNHSTKSDVWAVGITAIEMHQGKLIFEGKEEQNIILLIDDETTFHDQIKDDDQLEEFVRCCLRRDPEERLDTDGLLILPLFEKTATLNL